LINIVILVIFISIIIGLLLFLLSILYCYFNAELEFNVHYLKGNAEPAGLLHSAKSVRYNINIIRCS